jgi:hypothetical protein
MPSLEILDISRNKIKRLPGQSGSLINLRVRSVVLYFFLVPNVLSSGFLPVTQQNNSHPGVLYRLLRTRCLEGRPQSHRVAAEVCHGNIRWGKGVDSIYAEVDEK